MESTLTSNAQSIRGEVQPDSALTQGQVRWQEHPFGRFVHSAQAKAKPSDLSPVCCCGAWSCSSAQEKDFLVYLSDVLWQIK